MLTNFETEPTDHRGLKNLFCASLLEFYFKSHIIGHQRAITVSLGLMCLIGFAFLVHVLILFERKRSSNIHDIFGLVNLLIFVTAAASTKPKQFQSI